MGITQLSFLVLGRPALLFYLYPEEIAAGPKRLRDIHIPARDFQLCG